MEYLLTRELLLSWVCASYRMLKVGGEVWAWVDSGGKDQPGRHIKTGQIHDPIDTPLAMYQNVVLNEAGHYLLRNVNFLYREV